MLHKASYRPNALSWGSDGTFPQPFAISSAESPHSDPRPYRMPTGSLSLAGTCRGNNRIVPFVARCRSLGIASILDGSRTFRGRVWRSNYGLRSAASAASWPRKVFCERLPGIARAYGRQTERASEIVRITGYVAGGLPGQRLLARLSIATSDDTVLRRGESNRRRHRQSRFTIWALMIGLGGKAKIMERFW
jgi:hypothetical protein